MTNDKDIGKLEGKMDLVLDQIKTVHIKLDRLETKGCVKGEANEIAIDKLEKRTGRLEGILSKAIVIGAISAGGGAGLVKMIESVIK